MTSFFRPNVYSPFPHSSSMKIHRVKEILAMKVEIQSRKWIKPSLSTPPTLSPHKISFIDEFSPNMNLPLVLFFPPNTNFNPRSTAKLEESLKKTLTLLYPLAGRYIDDMHTVDCNDQGVEFIQAKTDITIQEITDRKVDPMLINEFIPSKLLASDMLATQVTMFTCGGLSLAVSISHRIGDVSTIVTFLNQWATLSRGDTDGDSVMGFTPSSSFPARGLPYTKLGFFELINKDDYVTKKLTFSESAIADMKTKVAMNGGVKKHQLFKVQLVSGLIWKAFIGVDHAIYHRPRDSILVQPIALRQKGERITSLTPKHSLGNYFGLIVTEASSGTTKTRIEFEELTGLLVDSVMKSVKEYSKVGYDGHEREEMVLNSLSRFNNIPDTTNVVWLVSWSKFPFYDINFGFGKPIWVSCGYMTFKRGMVLLDDAGGNGVEAYVTMGIKDVPYFEQDEDIKAFST